MAPSLRLIAGRIMATLGYIRVVTTADQRAQKKAAEGAGKPAHWVDESEGAFANPWPSFRKHGFKDHINVGVSSFSLLARLFQQYFRSFRT